MSIAPNKSLILKPTNYDVQMMLAAEVHLGSKNLTQPMAKYVFKRRQDGIHVLNLAKTWEKLILAARVIVAVENPHDVAVVSTLPNGQRSVIKFSTYTGAQYYADRFFPGTFTNPLQNKFLEPRLLVVTDPRADHQAVREASYGNIPVIAFCDSDSPLKFVDIAIPINNRSKSSVAIMWWLLTREVLRMKGTISRKRPWNVKPDLFLHREEDETKEKLETKEGEKEGEKKKVETVEQVVATKEENNLFASTEGTNFFQA